MKYHNRKVLNVLIRNRLTVSTVALVTVLGSVVPAWSTIDNTVTVTGSSPGGTDDITDSATEKVDVDDAAPVLTVTKVASKTVNAKVGDVITYTYTVTNDGNVGVTNVSLSDNHNVDADGSLSAIAMTGLTNDGGSAVGDSTDDAADANWDYLAPGDEVTWSASYTVTQTDLTSESADGDGDLENTVTASAGYEDTTGAAATITETATEIVDLEDPNPSLNVAKTATVGGSAVDGLSDDVSAGDVITYTYVITNDGNVPITNVSLGDVFNGSGTFTVPNADSAFATLTDNGPTSDSSDVSGDSKYDLLAPADVLTITTTYTVTQSDLDGLQ